VTTTNLVPSEDDLLRVITRGMPGSAMVPFAQLPEFERRALARYVVELTREGMARQALADARTRGDTPDEPEMRKEIDAFLTPGPKLEIPSNWPAADAASVARGLALYKITCASCHGETGKGDGAQDQVDAAGVPIRPRDFGRGIFKGGREREQLYARIVLGMKGTPMPSSALKPEEVGDVINFIHSLSPPTSLAKVEHQRKKVVARRDQSASASGATPVVVSPLWWTDRPEVDLEVSAAHDGRTVTLRLSWADTTRDDSIARPDAFEDMASVQVFDRRPEPFFGMGADGAAPDLWLWRATWDRPRDFADSILDNYPFGGRSTPFSTARAAGNLHARADEPAPASNLVAQGPGSVTFRPRSSQLVTTKATWSAGRWVVEFQRPLALDRAGGISLKPGHDYSVAFALWDGAARDRNGQKQVSIWHDLRIE